MRLTVEQILDVLREHYTWEDDGYVLHCACGTKHDLADDHRRHLADVLGNATVK